MRKQQPYCSVHTLALSRILLLAALPVIGVAQEKEAMPESGFTRFCKQEYLFGDWGGLRTGLKQKGVDFEFLYLGAVPSNVGGGIKRGSVYEGALMMTLDIDSDKLVGYEGGQFHVGGLSIHNGPEFSANYVGDLNKVSLLDFPDNLNLWELWYEQKFLDDKVAVKFGQLAIDRDFILPQYYNSLSSISFLNQAFFYPTLAFDVWDQPYFPAGHHGLASTPYGTPGVRLRVDPVPYAYFQVGAYSGEADRSRGDVTFPLSEQSGALIYSELTLKLNQAPGAQGPPGNLKLGGYYHTGDFYDIYDGFFSAVDNYLVSQGQPKLSDNLAAVGLPVPSGFTDPRKYSGDYGLYFLADQTLWREVGKDDPAQQGMVGFFRVAGAPTDRNLTSFGIDGGLVYKGLIPNRDWDSLGLAVSYLEMSDDLRRAQSDINSNIAEINAVTGLGLPPAFAKLADYEAVIELSYRAQLTAWWTLQPSVQRVFHPGGRVLADIPDAWVVIVQTAFRF